LVQAQEHRRAWRCGARIVLACAGGGSNTAVAARLGVSRGTVSIWRARFLARRLDGLHDEPRPGVPRTITDAKVEEVIVRTPEEVPEGTTHWSKRELARRVAISPTSVHRIWQSFGLQPYRTEKFKISPRPAAHRQDPRCRRPLPCAAGEHR
jgi:transposase